MEARLFSRMRSEGFPFIVWGSGGWTLVRVVLVGLSRCRRGVVVAGSKVPLQWGSAERVSFNDLRRAFEARRVVSLRRRSVS